MTERVPHWRLPAALGALALALGATVMAPPRPLLVWNASASAPIGLYLLGDPGHAETGTMVIAWPPAPARLLAARRGYVPLNVPLVKRVAAGRGDRVCALDTAIEVNGRPVATRRARDGLGRRMPLWRGCVILDQDALFLLMPGDTASFDGRYFGPTRRADIVGTARLIWAR